MNAVGASGYALVGVLYLFLTALLLTAWRGQRIGAYLVLACLMSVVWSGTLAIQTAGGSVSPLSIYVVEVLRTGAWIAFIARLLLEISASRTVRYLAHLVWLGVLAAGLVYASISGGSDSGQDLGTILMWGGLLTALTGLVLIEQLYRNSSQDARWSLKLLLLGLGGMFAYDLFLYSQAVMFNALDATSWIARGPVNVFFVPLIAAATRRNPDWELRIFVSRQVVFYTTTLTAVGLYLILMSAGGYLIVRYGGDWGGLLRVVFLVGAGVVLVTLLFSSTLLARVKVFLSKHFFQNKYDYREEWLRLIATLSRFQDSSTRNVVVKAMAQIVDSPAGLLWIQDEQSGLYRLAAKYGTDQEAPDLAADDAVVHFIKRDGWLIDLNEYEMEPGRYPAVELPDWLEQLPLGWLIVPVMYGKELMGLVLLFKSPGMPELNYEDRDLLKTVGNHIAVLLAQEKSDRLLAEAKQFEAYNRLTAFLMHDLNNLVAQQSLIVANAEKHKRNPEFVDDAIDTIKGSVARVRRVIEHIQQRPKEHPTKKVEVGKLVMQAVSQCADREPAPRARLGDGRVWVRADRERLLMAIYHGIRNAQDATPADGSVSVEVRPNGRQCEISIIDTGCGMDEAFVRERLFRPFESTKGTAGMGIGAYQIRETVRMAGGRVDVESAPDRGTRLTMVLDVES